MYVCFPNADVSFKKELDVDANVRVTPHGCGCGCGCFQEY